MFQAKKTTPAKNVAADPEAKAIAAIEKTGATIRPIAQNDDRREVSFYLQGQAIKDADIAPVAQLKKVVQLHLGKTAITDAGLAHIKGLTELEQLHLEQTRITDKGLANLKGLAKLTYLNLYGTEVTDAGLDNLKGLAALKSLYVWQTKVTGDGVKKLKQSIPGLEVIEGWDLPPVAPPKEAPKEEKK